MISKAELIQQYSTLFSNRTPVNIDPSYSDNEPIFRGLVPVDSEITGKYKGVETDEGRFFGVFVFVEPGMICSVPKFKNEIEEKEFYTEFKRAFDRAKDNPFVLVLVDDPTLIKDRVYTEAVVPGYTKRFAELWFQSEVELLLKGTKYAESHGCTLTYNWDYTSTRIPIESSNNFFKEIKGL